MPAAVVVVLGAVAVAPSPLPAGASVSVCGGERGGGWGVGGSQRKWETHLSRKFETPLVELSP